MTSIKFFQFKEKNLTFRKISLTIAHERIKHMEDVMTTIGNSGPFDFGVDPFATFSADMDKKFKKTFMDDFNSSKKNTNSGVDAGAENDKSTDTKAAKTIVKNSFGLATGHLKGVAIGTGVPAIGALVALIALAILFPPAALGFIIGVSTAATALLALGITAIVYGARTAQLNQIAKKTMNVLSDTLN